MKERQPTREEKFYKQLSAGLLRSQVRDMNLSYKGLSRLLEDGGIGLRNQALNNKVVRGTYSLGFALHVLAVLGVKSIEVPALPLAFSLQVTEESLRLDSYPVPARFTEYFGKDLSVRGSCEPMRTGKVRISNRGRMHGLHRIFVPRGAGQVFDVDVDRAQLLVSLRDG